MEMIDVGKPIHLSEITITAADTTDRGRMIQAIIARNMYRLWFSRRHLLADCIRRRLARSRAAFLLRTTPGFLETVLIRQLPLPGLLTTLALAVSKTRLSAMLLGSFVGWLPSTWIVTMLSGSAAQAQVPGPWIAASMAGACLLLILLKRAARRHRIGMLGTLPAHRTRRNA